MKRAMPAGNEYYRLSGRKGPIIIQLRDKSTGMYLNLAETRGRQTSAKRSRSVTNRLIARVIPVIKTGRDRG